MLNFAKYSLLIYLLLKPYYLFSSGGLQIADLFLVLGFALICIAAVSSDKNRSILKSIFWHNKLLLLFIAFTVIINSFYFMYYPEKKFIMSSLYYIFNLFAITAFSVSIGDKKFLEKAGRIFKLNLGIQLAVWALGLGRDYDLIRYMGTFNDPNQFGYYALLSLLFIFTIDTILSKKYTYVWYIVALWLIYLSSSTGMLLGVASFSVLLVAWYVISQRRKSYALVRRVIYTLSVGMFLLLPPVLMLASLSDDRTTNAPSEISVIVGRTDEKLKKAEGEASISLWEDRGLDTISKYPEYVLFGSGEGGYKRFVGVTNNYGNEIHSTFPSILFYYGIVPTLLLIGWFARYLRGVGITGWTALLPLFVTSFVLLNQRQALFWVLIILVGIYMSKNLASFRKKIEGII